MRIDLGAKSAIFPMPVLIIGTYDKDGNANAMNAAWGNICDYEKISIAIAKDHKTVENILETKAFTISFATAEEVVPSDFVGIISGNKDCDKIKKTGWIVEKSNKVNAPIFDKLPVTLECTLESYDEKTEICIGKIVNMSVADNILTDGKIDLEKFHPISYDGMNHQYIALGKTVAKAFKVGEELL